MTVGDSRLSRTLRAGHFAITAEVTPPLAAGPAPLLARAMPLKGLVDGLNVTDGASARAHLSSLAAASILAANGIEPVLQFTCRDRNRIALQSDLLGAAAFGVVNLLMLRGDDPSAGDQPDAKPVFDLDSRTLLETAAAMRDKGVLPSGREIDGRPDYFLGAADIPGDPEAGWKPGPLAAKADAGAEFVQTQFCFDTALVRRYAAGLAAAGLDKRLFVLIGIGPLASARSARWMKANLFGTTIPDAIVERLDAASDPRAEGVAICADLMKELAEIPGIGGCHLMAPLNEAAVPTVIGRSGLLERRGG